MKLTDYTVTDYVVIWTDYALSKYVIRYIIYVECKLHPLLSALRKLSLETGNSTLWISNGVLNCDKLVEASLITL